MDGVYLDRFPYISHFVPIVARLTDHLQLGRIQNQMQLQNLIQPLHDQLLFLQFHSETLIRRIHSHYMTLNASDCFSEMRLIRVDRASVLLPKENVLYSV